MSDYEGKRVKRGTGTTASPTVGVSGDLIPELDLVIDGETGRHLCHAVDCTRLVAASYLMCGRHWAMVSRDVQRAVDDAAVAGPSWLTMAHLAISQAADADGLPEAADSHRVASERWREEAARGV